MFCMIFLLAYEVNTDLKELWITILVSSINFCLQHGFKLHKKSNKSDELELDELDGKLDSKNGSYKTIDGTAR